MGGAIARHAGSLDVDHGGSRSNSNDDGGRVFTLGGDLAVDRLLRDEQEIVPIALDRGSSVTLLDAHDPIQQVDVCVVLGMMVPAPHSGISVHNADPDTFLRYGRLPSKTGGLTFRGIARSSGRTILRVAIGSFLRSVRNAQDSHSADPDRFGVLSRARVRSGGPRAT